MEKSFNIKQNSFITFVLNYSAILLSEVVLYIFLLKLSIPDFITKSLAVILLISAIVKGILSLKNNNRTLFISKSGIKTIIGKNNKLKVLQYIKSENIQSIEEVTNGIFLIKLVDGTEDILTLSYYLKPSNKLVLDVKRTLCEIFDEKSKLLMNEDLKSYINTNNIPENLLKMDKSENFNRIILTILSIIFVGLPTILGILAILLFSLQSIVFVLEQIIRIFG